MMICFSTAGCIEQAELENLLDTDLDLCAGDLPVIRESNGTLRIITYDIYALSEEVVQDLQTKQVLKSNLLEQKMLVAY